MKTTIKYKRESVNIQTSKLFKSLSLVHCSKLVELDFYCTFLTFFLLANISSVSYSVLPIGSSCWNRNDTTDTLQCCFSTFCDGLNLKSNKSCQLQDKCVRPTHTGQITVELGGRMWYGPGTVPLGSGSRGRSRIFFLLSLTLCHLSDALNNSWVFMKKYRHIYGPVLMNVVVLVQMKIQI